MAKKATKTTKTAAAKPYRIRRFGIQNHVGGVWSPETFQTEKDAAAFLEKQRQLFNGLTKKHKVVPVRVTISIPRS